MVVNSIPNNSLPPFPCIEWWAKAVALKKVEIRKSAPYRKNWPLNRYILTGSQGKQTMSIPLVGGRNQKNPFSEVLISFEEDWQSHHWKTMQTLYRRSPFFEYYAPEIEYLYHQKIKNLMSWNKESIQAIQQFLNLDFQIIEVEHLEETAIPKKDVSAFSFIPYHQVFEDQLKFQENCSILDLIFCEGKNATNILNQQAETHILNQ